MNTSTLRHLLKKNILWMIFSLYCVFFSTENAFSDLHWRRDYTRVSYNYENNYIEMTAKIFDYDFGNNGVGWLKSSQFEYSCDGMYYFHLMNVDTGRQKQEGWTWVDMSNKLSGADIRFIGCHSPASGTKWEDNTTQRIRYNDEGDVVARMTAYWYVPRQLNVKFIRFKCEWTWTGKSSISNSGTSESFNEVYKLHFIPDDNIVNNSNVPRKLPKNEYLSESKALKVYSESDDVVIKYAEPGDNIEIYNTVGKQVDERIANSDVIRIKLPTKKMYIVKVGKERHMIAL